MRWRPSANDSQCRRFVFRQAPPQPVKDIDKHLLRGVVWPLSGPNVRGGTVTYGMLLMAFAPVQQPSRHLRACTRGIHAAVNHISRKFEVAFNRPVAGDDRWLSELLAEGIRLEFQLSIIVNTLMCQLNSALISIYCQTEFTENGLPTRKPNLMDFVILVLTK